MAEHGFNYGNRGGTSAGFLGLDQKYVTAIIIAVVVGLAILGAAFLLRPTSPSADPRVVACIESGGNWAPAFDMCNRPVNVLP